MLRNLNFFSWLVVMLGSFALSSSAHAIQPHVEDAGGFFDADTISKANAIIAQIKHDTGRDLMVETLPSIPESLKPKFQELGKDPFYLQWSYDRARELGINGVYILVTREPRHLQVLVGSVTLAKYFPEEARTQLTELLINAFKNNDYNGGLLRAAEYVQKTMMANAMARQNQMEPPAASGTGGSVGGWICLGVAILVGLVLLVNFFGRRASGFSQGGYPPGAPPSGYPPGYTGGYGGGGGGGGGFGRGLLGGLLGGAVGGWAYDRFMRGGGSGGGFPTEGGPVGGTPSDVDTSYTSSGGDFGNSGDTGASAGGDFGDTSSGDASSSGSDFGDGGASAGGDFGGGDSGGGGGGGGDF